MQPSCTAVADLKLLHVHRTRPPIPYYNWPPRFKDNCVAICEALETQEDAIAECIEAISLDGYSETLLVLIKAQSPPIHHVRNWLARLQDKIAACKSRARGPLHACTDDCKPLAQYLHAMGLSTQVCQNACQRECFQATCLHDRASRRDGEGVWWGGGGGRGGVWGLLVGLGV